MSVMEKVAVHIHALNKNVANDPRVTATILPIGSGLTIAQNCDIEGTMFLRLYKGMSTILPAYCYFFFFIELSLLFNSRLLSHCRPVQKCLSCCYGFDG